MSANQPTNQDQFISDEVVEPDELPEGVTVDSQGNTETQELAQSGNVDIDPALQEIQSQEASGQGKRFTVENYYDAGGTRYQQVNYKGIDETGYRTASGQRINAQEFFDNLPSNRVNVRNNAITGEQVTKYELDGGNEYYVTAEPGGTPTRRQVDSTTQWADASRYDVKSYQSGGNGNATIYTPDGLQRTTRSKVQDAMNMIGNYKKNGTMQTITINGTTYNSRELFEAGKDSPLPNGEIFLYDGK